MFKRAPYGSQAWFFPDDSKTLIMKKISIAALIATLFFLGFRLVAQNRKVTARRTAIDEQEKEKAGERNLRMDRSVTPASSSRSRLESSREPINANSSNDRKIGKDEKGRILYEGVNGGRYYFTHAGNKEYVRQPIRGKKRRS